ncbi:MAG TPA: homoserine kinase [Candidatus Nanopelagicales bacterium]|nr:homoserine kinase [Candidatus Nanopelagicales bacterium]
MSTPRVRSGPVRVLVPASSANLGPGFDSLGLALAVYDELIAMATEDDGVLVEVAGEGAEQLPRDQRHLVAQSMDRAFEFMGVRPAGFILRCRNAIPQGRGLGSSAAAIIGGMVLARAMIDEPQFSDQELLHLATAMESHPDNLAAALYGGFTVAWLDEDLSPGAVRLVPHPQVHAVLALPEEVLATTEAREALPETVAYGDASHNLARSALLVHALTQQPELLWEATSDRLHQQVRAKVYPHAVELLDSLRSARIPAAISGAGPAVLVLSSDIGDVAKVEAIASDVGSWTVRAIPISSDGAGERPIEV